ncbi:hypothetical protein N0V82_001766 [Gnomoniopsis sp. IMI 355080]|nr:hypothetical protein N0V82_001766 [Gnomoniopsis sp. IMI 355080]
MSNGPLPSQLTLLSSLPSVTSYSMVSAQLTLQHNFPKTSEVTAVVDVRLLLEKLDAEKTAIGQWVNVIGYISASPPKPASKIRKAGKDAVAVHIQALMLWSAGPLDIRQYELCLLNRAETNSAEAERSEPGII